MVVPASERRPRRTAPSGPARLYQIHLEPADVYAGAAAMAGAVPAAAAPAAFAPAALGLEPQDELAPAMAEAVPPIVAPAALGLDQDQDHHLELPEVPDEHEVAHFEHLPAAFAPAALPAPAALGDHHLELPEVPDEHEVAHFEHLPAASAPAALGDHHLELPEVPDELEVAHFELPPAAEDPAPDEPAEHAALVQPAPAPVLVQPAPAVEDPAPAELAAAEKAELVLLEHAARPSPAPLAPLAYQAAHLQVLHLYGNVALEEDEEDNVP